MINQFDVDARIQQRASAALPLELIEPWAPHPSAAPRCERRTDSLVIDANGTRTCAGGWQLRYTLPETSDAYDVRILVEHAGVEWPEDCLHATVFWGQTPTDQAARAPLCPWDYLQSERLDDGLTAFRRQLTPPPGATHLTIR